MGNNVIKPLVKTNCSVCGNGYMLSKGKYSRNIKKGYKMYCSPVCLRVSARKGKGVFAIKKCTRCSTDFEPQTHNQLTCSKECRNSIAIQKYNENKKITDFQIFERDGFKCSYCGKSSIEHGVELVIDHIYPRNQFGGNEIYNLTTSCIGCNLAKTDIVFDVKIIERIFDKNMQTVNRINSSYKELQEYFNKRWSLRLNTLI